MTSIIADAPSAAPTSPNAADSAEAAPNPFSTEMVGAAVQEPIVTEVIGKTQPAPGIRLQASPEAIASDAAIAAQHQPRLVSGVAAPVPYRSLLSKAMDRTMSLWGLLVLMAGSAKNFASSPVERVKRHWGKGLVAVLVIALAAITVNRMMLAGELDSARSAIVALEAQLETAMSTIDNLRRALVAEQNAPWYTRLTKW